MAAGFAESYIRLWSLKGEKLKGLRSDFSSSSVKDGPFQVYGYSTSINPPNSFISEQDKGKEREYIKKINRPQRACLLRCLRPAEWIGSAPKISSISLG